MSTNVNSQVWTSLCSRLTNPTNSPPPPLKKIEVPKPQQEISTSLTMSIDTNSMETKKTKKLKKSLSMSMIIKRDKKNKGCIIN
ncbi:hypothetical protein CYY_000268 [Polysphondylium violaceum]|uniref:Uncharacterized protein n=1 Tax=Polysphondylium violaceum TaxID=133409 RepID=A0A8J4QB94_9MYCE|nr:hypothetical protein CYY_000268 [Polysphondylium violaceum]